MIETELLSVLIGDIYDAALDASVWQHALGKAAEFVGGPAAALFSKNVTSKTGSVAYDSGVDPYYRELYFDRYIKLDPATTGHFFSEVEEPMATADLMPYAEFLESRFYREWARPQGLVDFIACSLDKSATSTAMFGVFRHERDGIATDETRARMRLIVPHVRRAVLVSRLIDLKSAESSALADAFDTLSAGMFLVDAAGRVVHANVAGRVILSNGIFLQVTGSRLTATDPDTDGTLHDTFAAAGRGDAAIGVKGIAVPFKTDGGERYVAHVLPLTSGARQRAGAAHAAAAAVFVHKATMETPSPPEVLAKAFKLTPTELRVLLAIVEVGGVPEVAEVLGVAETTIKTHLSRLYEKTGRHRQADLVKLVAGFSNPLLS